MATPTFASVTIGSLTFTAKRWAQNPTITFTAGATAGQEVVTMDASLNITIKIASGTSTNLQIKNAVLAVPAATNGFSVNDVVSVSIVSGHNSDTQVAAQTVFAGGLAAAVKAKVQVGGLVFTAHTAGTAGNSLQVKYTSGATAGSEVVTDPNSNGHPLQIQIADYGTPTYTPVGGNPTGNHVYSAVTTGSTLGQVKAAIDTWQSGHTTYFDITYAPGFSSADPAYVSSASTARTLSGGLAAAASVATLQGVTATSNTNTAVPNGLTLTFTPGATAGAEVVTDNPDGSFSVQIQSGTSTPTQIAAALNADTTFAASYTATHPGSTAVVANWRLAMSGAVAVNQQMIALDESNTTLTTSYVYFPFGFRADHVWASNRDVSASKELDISLDGVNQFDDLEGSSVANSGYSVNESSEKDYGALHISGVYLKYTGSTAPSLWDFHATAQL